LTDPLAGRPNPRYIALLVGAALLILLVGAFLRPRAKEVPIPAPTHELATLPERSQRRAFRDMADYVAERAATLSASIIYLPEVGTSGLVLGPDSVLTAVADSAPRRSASIPLRFVVESLPPGDSARPAIPRMDTDTAPRWTMVVARRRDGQVLSLAGLTGGTLETQCGDFLLQELVFDAVVPVAFAGGGAFDLDGNAIGLAIPCGSRTALVPLAEISRLLALQQSVEYQLWTHYGLRVRPGDSAYAPLSSTKGLVVTELLMGGPASRAGVRAGDVILRVSGQPVSRVQDLARLLDGNEDRPLLVQRTPSGLLLGLRPRTDSSEGFSAGRPSPQPSEVLSLTTVEPGSRAARAGLQPGDRILQVGRYRPPTAALLRRVLADTTPVLLVYQRNGRQHAVVLR
jgi:hypothetical protein